MTLAVKGEGISFFFTPSCSLGLLGGFILVCGQQDRTTLTVLLQQLFSIWDFLGCNLSFFKDLDFSAQLGISAGLQKDLPFV